MCRCEVLSDIKSYLDNFFTKLAVDMRIRPSSPLPVWGKEDNVHGRMNSWK